MVERRLSNEEIDKELSKIKFKSQTHQSIFEGITDKSWFRSYGRQSKVALKKITAKVKAGIKHGQFTYAGGKTEEPPRGFEKPERKKPSKKLTKRELEVLDKLNGVKKKYAKNEKLSRAEKELIEWDVRRAPSGRQYSRTEIHEKVGSKRAKEWRKKNGIKESDWS